jgi:hypothetical protein
MVLSLEGNMPPVVSTSKEPEKKKRVVAYFKVRR